ncbi:Mur ligase family protein [Rossellomorea aquimaris]|uniref:Mur ligase family protein n=1 Tax=Rossellomorea aquimaris TaxID=189382 RepID=UPI0007D07759|nr:UDP-N-acetylmuramoyl-tripeptide--D-alanyl-D-alanine ligase [Rossellomorea aquimaris]
MKPIPLKDIIQVINGRLLIGQEDFMVEDAMVFHLHRIKMKNTLIFLDKKKEFDIRKVRRYKPYVLITDKNEEELRDCEASGIITVESMRNAFWSFTRFYRKLFNIPVIAITGTCGKTTTKEIISHILSSSHNVVSTFRSRNATRKSFQYLLEIDEHTDVGVFETGLGGPGNLQYHCDVYEPTVGIITTIGIDHLDKCKTIEGYIEAKSEIVAGLRKNGTLILNKDDENTQKVSLEHFQGKVVYCGFTSEADYTAQNISYGKDGMHFTFVCQKKEYTSFVSGYGRHQIYNALFALAAIHTMGVDMEYAVDRLKTFENLERHLQIQNGVNRSILIDDTWSTNPTSLAAAIEVVEHVKKEEGKQKTALLLGDIAYLGEKEEEIHRELGSLIASKSIDELITIGKNTRELGNQAIKDGFQGAVCSVDSPQHVLEYVKSLVDDTTVLLIKGSMMDTELMNLALALKKT